MLLDCIVYENDWNDTNDNVWTLIFQGGKKKKKDSKINMEAA